MRRLISALAALAIATPAFAESKTDSSAPRAVIVQALPSGSQPRPVTFARARAQMTDAQAVGVFQNGVMCLGESIPIYWRQIAGNFAHLKDVFGEELKAAGFKPDTDPGSLFSDGETSSTDLQVGAQFKSADARVCESTFHITSTVQLDIEWQVYSSLKREVVATIETHEGSRKIKDARARDEGRSVYQEAFAANVRSLLSDENFRRVVSAQGDAPPRTGANSAAKTPIQLVGATTRTTPLPDAVGSVVTIFAGAAFGSGVLVSSDGYLLTNHHVVGDGTEVRIRWSDGFETTGRVIRSDKRRDVALVKTESRGRTALAVNRTAPQPGTPVFAIGAPLDPQLQSTVTRGIVSANRIVDGFSFIQSDTPVTHGNSGGPLLDEHGAILGLTDWGVPAEKGSSLNFFIPIGDALDFLALKETESTSPVQPRATASKGAAKP